MRPSLVFDILFYSSCEFRDLCYVLRQIFRHLLWDNRDALEKRSFLLLRLKHQYVISCLCTFLWLFILLSFCFFSDIFVIRFWLLVSVFKAFKIIEFDNFSHPSLLATISDRILRQEVALSHAKIKFWNLHCLNLHKTVFNYASVPSI